MAQAALTLRSAARILIVGILLASAYNSVWFEVKGKGVYTEGLQREPTIWANYSVDSTEEKISTEITNATPLLQYWNARENLPDTERQEQTESSRCNNICLEEARNIYKLLICSMLLIEVVSLLKRNKFVKGVSIVNLFGGILCISLLIPIAAVSDFGFGGGEKSSGGFTTGESDSADINEFAYYNSNSDIYISSEGLVLEFNSEGYDLALMSEEEREQVTQEKPQNKEHWIAFEAKITANSNSTLIYWLLVPFTWYVFGETRYDPKRGDGSMIPTLSPESNETKHSDGRE